MRYFHWGVVTIAFSLHGCASVVVDPDGTRHVTGFIRLTVAPPAFKVGADVVRVRAVGLSVINGPGVGTSVVLGYGDASIAAIRNDSQVASAALESVRAGGTKEEAR